MKKVIFWFRRDLRLIDNHGLFQALKSGHPVVPIFIFDPDILERLPDRSDRRVQFIHSRLLGLQKELRALGSELVVRSGKPLEVFKELIQEFQPGGVFLNRDHDPYPKRRDHEVQQLFQSNGLTYQEYQDHFVFERNQILTDKGTPYTVFTPYSKKWMARIESDPNSLVHFPSEKHVGAFAKGLPIKSAPSMAELGFQETSIVAATPVLDLKIVEAYEQRRNDVFDERSTSGMGIHLRFGTVSVRELVRLARPLSKTWLSEIAWRDFFSQVLYHFPQVVKHSFRPEFDNVAWSQNQEHFERWKEGMTGFPLVDAGMRQLNTTGNMANRVRMNVASFLCKDLLIHWSWGERYFAGILLDYDLSSNNGNWQWAAGTGCDAAPYFRVFNPEVQRLKFDPNEEYVRRWIPEWKTAKYPKPMVDHAVAARTAIAEYAKAKKG
ncbi:MAG: hypothetical protein RJB66_2178 [Pseudomonadota bacterium]|jgi:deoxyribodipyrimidine photo-lyase